MPIRRTRLQKETNQRRSDSKNNKITQNNRAQNYPKYLQTNKCDRQQQPKNTNKQIKNHTIIQNRRQPKTIFKTYSGHNDRLQQNYTTK